MVSEGCVDTVYVSIVGFNFDIKIHNIDLIAKRAGYRLNTFHSHPLGRTRNFSRDL